MTDSSLLGTNPIANGYGEGAARGGARLCGALSVETFVNQGPLS